MSHTDSSQSAFSATSHRVTIQGKTFEYVIGEMTLVSTDRTTGLIVTQGYLQPTDENRPSQIQSSGVQNDIRVYPNPTEDVVNLEFVDQQDQSFSYLLVDATGKVLFKKENETANRFQLDMRSYASGNYYLKLTTQKR